MSALDTQIQGTHYKNVKIQPIEIAYMLGASPAWCKLAKYLSRDKGDKKINLQKAVHCIQLDMELQYCSYYHSLADVCDGNLFMIYDFANQFTEDDNFADALINLYSGYHNLAIDNVIAYARNIGIDL